MDFRVDMQSGIGRMTFEKNTDLRTDIYFSLMIKKGTWWANPDFGCELYKIKKCTDGGALLAQSYIVKALTWLKQTGRSTDIQCTVIRNPLQFGRFDIELNVIQSNSVKLYFEMFADVNSGKINWSPVGGPST